jgi:PIN domain nuclease of toxin-antitoxin system
MHFPSGTAIAIHFDRLLIAQALSENLSIVSKDRVFADYTDLKVIW